DPVDVELLIDRAFGRAVARRAEHNAATDRSNLGRRRGVRPLVPDVAVRTDSRRRDRAWFGREGLERALGKVVAVELSASAVLMADEQRAPVGIPLGEGLAR